MKSVSGRITNVLWNFYAHATYFRGDELGVGGGAYPQENKEFSIINTVHFMKPDKTSSIYFRYISTKNSHN